MKFDKIQQKLSSFFFSSNLAQSGFQDFQNVCIWRESCLHLSRYYTLSVDLNTN